MGDGDAHWPFTHPLRQTGVEHVLPAQPLEHVHVLGMGVLEKVGLQPPWLQPARHMAVMQIVPVQPVM